MLGELQRDGLCDATLAERLFWTVLEHLQKLSPGFATGRQGKGLARPFRRVAPVSNRGPRVMSVLEGGKRRSPALPGKERLGPLRCRFLRESGSSETGDGNRSRSRLGRRPERWPRL